MEDNSAVLQQQKYIRMTTQPVQRLILKLSIPTIASMLITAAYNLADTYFVTLIRGEQSTVAIDAVTLSFSVMTIIQAFGFFVGQGASNYISRALGKRETQKASEMAATGLVLAILAGVLLGAVGEAFTRPIARLLGAKQDFLAPTVSYLRWIFLAAPFATASFCLNNQLRFQGNAIYAMVGVVSGAVLNIGLDPLLILVFRMGTAGAALATGISQAVSFLILLLGTCRGDTIRIHLKNVRFSAENFANIVKGGLPSLLRQGFASISVLVLNRTAGVVGEQIPEIGAKVLIAAFGLVSKITTTASYVIIGLGQGYQPVCGFNYGARLYKRVRKAFWFLVGICACWCVVLTLGCELFGSLLVNAFHGAEPKVRELATEILRIQAISFLVNCWVVPSNMTQQTIGETVSASVVAMARQGMFLMPLVLILPQFFGLRGLEVCQPISDVCALLLTIPLQLRILRRLKREASPIK